MKSPFAAKRFLQHAGRAVCEAVVAAVGPVAELERHNAVPIDLPGATLIPGLIEGHSHLLLHPYNEASWDDQVLKEPLALRVARAVVHGERTLYAGFTTVRDLGTEGRDTPTWG